MQGAVPSVAGLPAGSLPPNFGLPNSRFFQKVLIRPRRITDIIGSMLKPVRNLLAKLGLRDGEQTLVIYTVAISTAVCALIIVGFWAHSHFYGNKNEDPDALLQLAPDAHFYASEVTDLDVAAHDFAARRYMQAGQSDTALPHLQRIAAARRGKPAGLDALDRMVRAYLEIGDFDKALTAADRLMSTPDVTVTPSLQVCRAIAFYNIKAYDESAQILREVLEKEPNNAEALCFMGQMEAAAQTDSPAAEKFFRRALEADPNYTEARYQFARYFENNGDYQSARTFLQQVLMQEPLNVRAHARLGMIYYYELNAEAAIRSYQTALALNPYDYNTHYNLAEVYRTLMNDNESALRSFVAAIDVNPGHSDANFRAGLICAENGMVKEAARYFEASLQKNRRDPRRLIQLAAAYERVGDRDAALSVYKEITDIDPLHSIAIQKIKFLEAPE